MKSFFFIITILVFSFDCYSQNAYEVLKGHIDLETPKEHQLILISHSRCGHCVVAMEKIKQFEDLMDIIIIDYSSEEERRKLSSKYGKYIFVDGKKLKALDSPDFFPKLFLVKNDRIIWDKKGWFDKNLVAIKSKIHKP